MDDTVYQTNSSEICISIDEYEKLCGDRRRVQAVRDVMTEFYVKRKLLLDNPSDKNDHNRTVSLRRVTLNRISVIADRCWNG